MQVNYLYTVSKRNQSCDGGRSEAPIYHQYLLVIGIDIIQHKVYPQRDRRRATEGRWLVLEDLGTGQEAG